MLQIVPDPLLRRFVLIYVFNYIGSWLRRSNITLVFMTMSRRGWAKKLRLKLYQKERIIVTTIIKKFIRTVDKAYTVNAFKANRMIDQ